jgi:hypothetical protein
LAIGFHSLGKLLILSGLILVLAGGLLLLLGKIPYLGKLPGDILLQKRDWSFYFPLTTSILLTLIFSFLGRR